MKKSDIFWQNYLSLEKEAIEVSQYIFITDEKVENCDGTERRVPCDSQLETYSPHIADLLVRCCVQIESVSKELYFELGGPKQRGDTSIMFDEDCLKEIDKKWGTHNKCVQLVAPFFNLTLDSHRVMKPLKNAHKSKGIRWSKAYQAVKHDRYSCLFMGNVWAFLQALAALYLLNLYYRKDTWVSSYKEIGKGDYSMGSKLFAVFPPVVKQLWYGNNALESESPYVVTYNEDAYKRIKEMQSEDRKALAEYWQQQPELKEQAFQKQLKSAIENSSKNPNVRIMHIWELAKYRLNKLLPATLSFEDRKQRLLQSEAWNCRINQQNEHPSPDEIKEDNIQGVIESVAILWGMQIEHKYEKLEWIPMAMNEEICEIYIPS